MKRTAATIVATATLTGLFGLGAAGEASAGTWGGLGDPITCSGSTTIASRGIYSNGKYLGFVELRIGSCSGGAGAWSKTTSAIGRTDLVANVGRTTNFNDQAHADATNTGVYTRFIRYDYGRTQYCANGSIKDPARGIYLGDTICNK